MRREDGNGNLLHPPPPPPPPPTLAHASSWSSGNTQGIKAGSSRKGSFSPKISTKLHNELYLHCKENPIHVVLFWELRGISSSFHIHVSVSDLCIPRIGPHISCSRIGRSILGICINYFQTHDCGNWDFGRAIPFLGIFVSKFWYQFFAVCITVSGLVGIQIFSYRKTCSPPKISKILVLYICQVLQ